MEWPDDMPKTAEGSAVQQWEAAIEELPDGETKEELQDLNIHDQFDRSRIEEVVYHDVPDSYYTAVVDAWDDLKRTLEYD